MKFLKKLFKFFAYVLLAACLLLTFFYFYYRPVSKPDWGVSFSYPFARYLGLDWKKVYGDMLTDLKIKNLRVMAYWEELEPEPGKFNFADVDYMLKLAEQQNVKVLLVLGHKQPRWPECHEPSWYGGLSKTDQDAAVLSMLTASINHFKQFSSVGAWQIENEAFFVYGKNCPPISKDLLKRELALVKSLDSRDIVLTDSGEKGGWLPIAFTGGDIFGSTMYRQVYQDKWQRYVKYPLPPMFYRVRAGMLQLFAHKKSVIDAELQAEPWFNGLIFDTPWEKQQQLMNPKIFLDNINYAKKTGLAAHYVWGVEWWYWAKAQGHPEMWDAAKTFFNGL